VRRVACLAAELPATKPFRAAFALGEPRAGDKADLLPEWFRAHCPQIFSGAELEAQFRRAPLWLRLQGKSAQRDEVFAELADHGWTWKQSTVLDDAVEVLGDVDVTKSKAWLTGKIEVQDLGSQLLLESIGLESGKRWLDACAGAGGKTLQLARLLGAAGHIDAHDIRTYALAELHHRRDRLRLANDTVASIDILTSLPSDRTYDGVLVDAPCSGSGTWRRAPHLRWVTTEAGITEAASKQLALLGTFSRHVRSGGRLVYATCSLSRRENEDVVDAFLARHHEFRAAPFARTFGGALRGPGLTLLPGLHDTDGFFVASLHRR
jgi:16S rRNA (cytosine967-C5)-methyltransferase